MIVKTLYRYKREDGGTTTTTEQPTSEYTELYRLIADDGMALTDGETITVCVDTENIGIWEEVEAPQEYGYYYEIMPEDYNEALRELGVDI